MHRWWQSFHRALLSAYPARFQAEFAEELSAVFAQALAEAGSDPWALARLGWRELRDWPGAIVREHWQEWRRHMQKESSGAWLPATGPGPYRGPDFSWISAALYVGLVGWWVWLTVTTLAQRQATVTLPYLVLHDLPAVIIFAGGVWAFAQSRTAGQKALALQTALVLSPGTGDLVSMVFRLVPQQLRGQASASPETSLVILGFSLPWLLLMFAPGPLVWVAEAVGGPARSSGGAKAAAPSLDWNFGLLWGLATAVGWTATLIFPPLFVVPSVLQWLLLRRRVPQAAWWLAASLLGLLAGGYLATSRQMLDLYLARRDMLDSVLVYSTLGTALGVGQWLVLRHWSPKAHWWILLNMLAWPGGWALSVAAEAVWGWPVIGGLEPAIAASLAGLVTGLALTRLLPNGQTTSGAP
jgi:hypothetical protein